MSQEKLGKKKEDENPHIAPSAFTSQPPLQMETLEIENDHVEAEASTAEHVLQSLAAMADTHPLPYFPLSSDSAHVLREGVVVNDPLDHAAQRETKKEEAKEQKNTVVAAAQQTMFRPAPAQPLTVAEQLADTAIEAAAKNAILAHLAAFFLAIADALSRFAAEMSRRSTESAEMYSNAGLIAAGVSLKR